MKINTIWDLRKKTFLNFADGKLVAFPTETVYGLGANALDPEAVKAIYHTKRRPFTDPVIVHVTTMEMALNLVKIND